MSIHRETTFLDKYTDIYIYIPEARHYLFEGLFIAMDEFVNIYTHIYIYM
jgi:hypothetical protein